MYAVYHLTNWRLMTQGLFAHYEVSVHVASNIREKHCCCQGFSHCLPASATKMSFLEIKLGLPVPSWKLTLLCSITRVKVKGSTRLDVRP